MKITLDWNEYKETACQAIGEGCVLLENKNNVLPLKHNTTVAVFGRIQNYYYKSGTGSGGKVNVNKVYNIVEGLELSGEVVINKNLQKIYADWEKENPYDEGLGWGQERWSQDEMPLTEEIVSKIAAESEVAIVIIGRTAGEDKDNSVTKGSYLLSDEECNMLAKVRAGFKKVVVLLNVGNIIDMSFVELYKPDSVLYVWQGGMYGGIGAANVLTGKINPSGKLTDTIAASISDYPSDKWFGNLEGNTYSEDIYVGYRYFETFAKDKVLYPFGFGLSYTNFNCECISSNCDKENKSVKLQFRVTNTGAVDGKEVLQIYVEAPNGKLGKATKVLAAFDKTENLAAGKNQIVNFEIPFESFASFDDSGITSHKNCFVLEEGNYKICAGTDVRSASEVYSFDLEKLIILQECEEALAPTSEFERMHASMDRKIQMEPVPTSTIDLAQRRLERLPQEIAQTNTEFKLCDVLAGKISMEAFVSQLTDEDLSCIIRGEGMGSSLVTPGTASAFGGVSPRLQEKFGIPTACCDDGPSGMRLDCGVKAFALPNGTSLACSFNPKLVTKLYSFTGLEMQANKVENLLGPGMNIHRHPLNGRNFEYFSEDPLVTGVIGTAMVKGLRSSGVTGTIKHFCGNNQEANRYGQDSKISARALREIYLRGFEIAVKSGYADSIMTTYGMVNGIYTASSYDLNTTILRKDWGFTGIVMTDWWANINELGKAPDKTNFAAMIRSQNDLYMCCPSGKENLTGDNTLEALAQGRLTRGELQRSALNICNHVMQTQAMKRLMNTADEIEILNKPKADDDINLDEITFTVVEKEIAMDLSNQECKANANYILAFDVSHPGTYEVTLTGNSTLGPLAQLPCTLFNMGIPIASFVFNGSEGKDVSITKEIYFLSRFNVSRLFVASNGLNLKDIKIKYINDKLPF